MNSDCGRTNFEDLGPVSNKHARWTPVESRVRTFPRTFSNYVILRDDPSPFAVLYPEPLVVLRYDIAPQRDAMRGLGLYSVKQ